MVNLVIDMRETELVNVLNDTTCTIEALDIGDIVFRTDDGTILVIIERKTVADLKASICDGRHREQKNRMVKCVDKSRIVYLIEGNLNLPLDSKIFGMPVSTLVGSLINTQFRDGIKVYKTSTIEETANFIRRLLQKLQTDESTYFNPVDSSNPVAVYATTLKSKKKDNMTPNVWFICQLALIPQVSESIAVKITDVYPTVPLLVKAYESCESESHKTKLLSDITYPIKNDKTRRIGDRISERIYNMFYAI
jgi:hypothetical protein